MEFNVDEHLRNDTSFDEILLYDGQRNLFDYVLLSLSGCTNALQMLIIWLILFRSPATMHEYRIYLCGMAFSDMLFNFAIGFLIEPKLWAPDSLGCHAMGLAQFLGQNGGRIAYSVAAFALTCQTQFLMFSTIFRFASVKHLDHTTLHLYLQTFGFRVKMVVGVMAVALLVACVSFITFVDRQALIEWHFSMSSIPSNWSTVYQQELSTPLNRTGSTNQPAFNQRALLEAIGGIVDEEKRALLRYAIRTEVYSNEMKHIVNAIQLVRGYPILYLDFLAEWIFVMCCIYFCCILCVEVTCLGASIAVIRYLRRHRHCFNPQTYRMQLQLIVLLIIQLVEPMLLVFLPVGYIIVCLLFLNANKFSQEPDDNDGGCKVSLRLFNIQSRDFAQTIVLAFFIYSAVNSLLILCFVGPYRRELASLVRRPVFLSMFRKLQRVHAAAVEPNVQQQQANAIISTIKPTPRMAQNGVHLIENMHNQ